MGVVNPIRAIRMKHSLTVELRESLRTESDSLCELKMLRSAIRDFGALRERPAIWSTNVLKWGGYNS